MKTPSCFEFSRKISLLTILQNSKLFEKLQGWYLSTLRHMLVAHTCFDSWLQERSARSLEGKRGKCRLSVEGLRGERLQLPHRGAALVSGPWGREPQRHGACGSPTESKASASAACTQPLVVEVTLEAGALLPIYLMRLASEVEFLVPMLLLEMGFSIQKFNISWD